MHALRAQPRWVAPVGVATPSRSPRHARPHGRAQFSCRRAASDRPCIESQTLISNNATSQHDAITAASAQPSPLRLLATAPDAPTLLRESEPQHPRRLAVLLSGGVDSSVALALALAAGHKVEAFYLQIWFQEDFRNTWSACPWEAELRECEAVCASLGQVPLHVVRLTDDYWRLVVDECIRDVRRGRTPNPDVLCNSRWVELSVMVERKKDTRFMKVASWAASRR